MSPKKAMATFGVMITTIVASFLATSGVITTIVACGGAQQIRISTATKVSHPTRPCAIGSADKQLGSLRFVD